MMTFLVSVNVNHDQQLEFRSLKEFYIIIVLNKLRIVDKTKKIYEKFKIKRLWLRLWGHSGIHRPLLSSAGPGPMYRLNPPLISPGSKE